MSDKNLEPRKMNVFSPTNQQNCAHWEMSCLLFQTVSGRNLHYYQSWKILTHPNTTESKRPISASYNVLTLFKKITSCKCASFCVYYISHTVSVPVFLMSKSNIAPNQNVQQPDTGRWKGGVGVSGVKSSPVGSQYSPINTSL